MVKGLKKAIFKIEDIQSGMDAFKKPRVDKIYSGKVLDVAQLYGYHFCKKSIEVPYFPPVIWIEPTSICNLKCPMCLTGNGQVKSASELGMMDMELFMKIIGEIRHHPIIRVGLFFRGEPLIHPKIVDMVRIASQYNLNPYFHTNGYLMKPELAKDLIEAGLSYVSFSFDGETKEEYESIRVGGSFDTTLSNIKEFLRIKEKMQLATPHVVIQKIDFNGKGITDRYRQLFECLPVDEFKANPPHNWSGEIQEIKMGNNGNSLNIYPCPDPWQRLTICWNGLVVPCCKDMLQKMPVGDVKTHSIETIWNNTRIRKLRSSVASNANCKSKLCKGCSVLYVNNWTI